MKTNFFQLNSRLAKYATPLCGMVSLKHVMVITTTHVQRLEGAGIL